MSYVQMRCHMCLNSTGGCTGACNRYTPSPYQPGFADVALKGCICPPTAERTCQRWDCGRKSVAVSATQGGVVGKLADATPNNPITKEP